MLFNSLNFLIFFIVVTVGYFILSHNNRWKWLLAASCFFYMVFKPEYILILGFTIVVDYYVGIYLERTQPPHWRKLILVGSLIANVGILAVFKYYNFINDSVTGILAWAGYHNPIPYLRILLPIGLSFHTFQAMSYTIEVYRGNQKAEKHFGYYALYVMYYPQLVAGPIERPQNILHQFHQPQVFQHARVVAGLRLMLWGLFKKVVIADTLAYSVNSYYAQIHQTSNNSLIAIVFFSFQIYGDFSGYSDVARGASKVMGIELLENFRFPYFAHSVTEFWRKWHISLSTWFRDYVYMPLGGNQDPVKWKRYRNVLVVFLLSGIWHGANWTFVVWGVLHGVLLLVERMAGIHKNARPLGTLYTFVVVSLVWVLFRAENFEVAMQVYRKMASKQFEFEWMKINIGLGLIVLLLAIEYLQSSTNVETIFDLIRVRWVRFVVYIIIFDFILFSYNKIVSQQFIYFQF